MMACTNCSNPRIYKRRLCTPCWWYERRHDGRARPEHLVHRQVDRLIEKDLTGRLFG